MDNQKAAVVTADAVGRLLRSTVVLLLTVEVLGKRKVRFVNCSL